MKRQHKQFADEIIKGASEKDAYTSAYPKATGEAARVNGYKLLQKATIAAYVRQQSDKIASIATQGVITELKEEIKADVLTVSRKREILRQIAEGTHDVRENFFSKQYVIPEGQEKGDWITVPKSYLRKPYPFEIVKAIETDNKMSGENAPERKELTGKGGKDLLPQIMFVSADKLTDEQFQQYMKGDAGDNDTDI